MPCGRTRAPGARLGFQPATRSNRPLKQEFAQVTTAVDDTQQDHSAAVDAKERAVRLDDDLPEVLKTERFELGYHSGAPRPLLECFNLVPYALVERQRVSDAVPPRDVLEDGFEIDLSGV